MSTSNISFEFYPPRSESGQSSLLRVHERLLAAKPAYFSVTFGAGGSTQEGTWETVKSLRESGSDVAPHLSCIGTTRSQIKSILDSYQSLGVTRLVALRGDLPSGVVDKGDFHYANELVDFIRTETGNTFHIEVAAYPETHPQAASPQADLENFARKVKSGANTAITQYFFNADAYFRFVEDAQQLGVEVPIVAGIMPITNFTQLARFSDTCGAEIPLWIRKRLQSFGDDSDSIKSFGVDVVAALCERLHSGGAPGFHFYALNQSKPSLSVLDALGWI